MSESIGFTEQEQPDHYEKSEESSPDIKGQILSSDEEEEIAITLEENSLTINEYQEYINFAKEMFKKYSSKTSTYGYVFSKSGYNFQTVEELVPTPIKDLEKMIKDEGLTFDVFVFCMSCAIANILDSDCIEIKRSYEILRQYDSMYTYYSEKKQEKLEEAKKMQLDVNKIIKALFANNQRKLWEDAEEFRKSIQNIIDEIENYIISKKDFETIDKTIEYLNGIIKEKKQIIFGILNSNHKEETTKIKLKSFILFEGTDVTSLTENIPYITIDLNEESNKSLIDTSLLNSKNASEENNHYIKIPELIEDLLVYDNPRSISSATSSVEKKKDNIIDYVYESKNSREKENRTAMHRIRPTTNSNIRFVEQKIVLKKDTKILKKIK